MKSLSKIRKTSVIGICVLLVAAVAYSQIVTHDGLIASDVSGSNLTVSNTLAVGKSNTVYIQESAAIGDQNTFSGNGKGSLAVGTLNNMNGEDSTAIGEGNMVSSYAKRSLAVGLDNNMNSALNAIAVGRQNEIVGEMSASVGMFNYTTGGGSKSLAVGSYLYVWDHYSLVVGQWNENLHGPNVNVPDPGDGVFVVGNGTGITGPTRERNAFVVRRNGDVVVPSNDGTLTSPARFKILHTGEVILGEAQGDIAMGEYGQ